MRVLLLTGKGEFWADTLPAGLKELGCDVVHRHAEDTPTRKKMLAMLSEVQPDFVLTIGWSNAHTLNWRIAIGEACRESGTLHLYWAIEDITHHWRWTRPYVDTARPDLVLTINPNCVKSYGQIGYAAKFLPFGCNTALHAPVEPDPRYECDVALVATWYEHPFSTFRPQSMIDLLAPLDRLGCRVGIWGTGWGAISPDLGLTVRSTWLKGIATYRETPHIFSSAKIVLNPQNEAVQPQLTQRTMEILGCGACMITSANEGIERNFEHGQHLLSTISQLETRELLEYYLERPEERARIGQAGRQEILSKHTYRHRAEQVLEWAGEMLDRRKPIIQVPNLQGGGAAPKVIVIEEDSGMWPHTLPAGFRVNACPVRFDTWVDEGDLGEALAEFRPLFALLMGWTQTHVPARREIIRRVLDRYQTPLVYWAVEDPEWFEQWSLPLVREMRADLVLTVDPGCVSRYEAEGFRANYLPFACNPLVHRRVEPQAEYTCDVALVGDYVAGGMGQRGTSFKQLLWPLLNRRFNVKVWGRNWDLAAQDHLALARGVWQGPLPYENHPAAYSSAKIVIGLQNGQSPDQVAMSTFEALGSGAFLLTSATSGVQSLFHHGEHLVMSDSPEQTLRLVRHYLANPTEREEIAVAGQTEVYERHTYAHRAREAVTMLKQASPE